MRQCRLTSEAEHRRLGGNRGGDLLEAYCVKCRAKRQMKDAKAITMRNGKPATQGTCPNCGTQMFRIGKG